MRLAAAIASGFGSVLATFGARTAASAPTLPLPLRSRKRANERTPASMRISERLPMPSARRAAMKGAHVVRREPRQRGQRHPAAEMAGEEAEELAHVALIGLDRLRRHAPFGRQICEPAREFACDLGGRGDRDRERVLSLDMAPYISPLPSPFLKRWQSAGSPMAKRVVDVLLPVALDQAYSYRVPEELTLAPGDIVSVPLGARVATGVVWAENASPNPRLDNRMKDVEEKLDLPPLKPELRKFVDWVAGYTLTAARHGAAHGAAHGRASRARARARRRAPRRPAPKRMTAARGRVLALLADGLARGKSEVARRGGRLARRRSTAWSTKARWKAWCCRPSRWRARPIRILRRRTSPRRSAQAANALHATVAKGGYGVTLLDGVTGSGKTRSISRRSARSSGAAGRRWS